MRPVQLVSNVGNVLSQMNSSVRKIRFDFRILKKAEENLKWCMVSS